MTSTDDGDYAVLISPNPRDPGQALHELTELARKLHRHGCVVHLQTGHYLSDIAVFSAVPREELGGLTSLSLPWSELAQRGPLETLTHHELRHFEQHRDRLAARTAHQTGDRSTPVRPEVYAAPQPTTVRSATP